MKKCKYPEHVISKSIFNAKLQDPAPNPARSKNIIPFVITYCLNIDNKSLMQAVENKLKNISNAHLKSIYKDSNFILSLKQLKTLYRKWTSTRFVSNFKKIKKPVTYKCSGKRCEIFENYLNETDKFTMSHNQVCEIRRGVDSHSVNVIYCLKC